MASFLRSLFYEFMNRKVKSIENQLTKEPNVQVWKYRDSQLNEPNSMQKDCSSPCGNIVLMDHENSSFKDECPHEVVQIVKRKLHKERIEGRKAQVIRRKQKLADVERELGVSDQKQAKVPSRPDQATIRTLELGINQRKRNLSRPCEPSPDKTSRLTKSCSVPPTPLSHKKVTIKFVSSPCVGENSRSSSKKPFIRSKENLLLEKSDWISVQKSGRGRLIEGTSARTRRVYSYRDIAVLEKVMAAENKKSSDQSFEENQFSSSQNLVKDTHLQSNASIIQSSPEPTKISRHRPITRSRHSAIQSPNEREKHILKDEKNKLATRKNSMKNKKMAKSLIAEAKVVSNLEKIKSYSLILKKMCPKEVRIVLNPFDIQDYLQKIRN